MGRLDKRWWPLLEYQGRGEPSRQCFVDMTTAAEPDKRTVFPQTAEGDDLGWSGSPPNESSGAPEREQTERTSGEAYRRGWERIFAQG